jgi:flagellar basal body-associated protein FliL
VRKLLIVFIFAVLILVYPGRVVAGASPVKDNSQYTTPSGVAPSDGKSTETIVVHLHDKDQNNVVGDKITLSSSNDSTATFPQNDQTTDSGGNATFTVATKTPGDVKISLYDSTSGITFTDWFSVHFYDVTKGCINSPPAPVLSSVISNSNNNATLTWVDSIDPVSNYVISYGIESKKYIYGNPNVGPQGTKSFTVGSLTGNKKYYFVVAATNNCGQGGFSNELSVVAKPIPVTPAPTLIPTAAPVQTPDSTPISNTTVVLNAEPTPTLTQAPAASISDNNFDYKTMAIVLLIVGTLMVVGAFLFAFKKTESIPTVIEVNNQNPPTVIPPKQYPFSP